MGYGCDSCIYLGLFSNNRSAKLISLLFVKFKPLEKYATYTVLADYGIVLILYLHAHCIVIQVPYFELIVNIKMTLS